jgi:hypothetical protein
VYQLPLRRSPAPTMKRATAPMAAATLRSLRTFEVDSMFNKKLLPIGGRIMTNAAKRIAIAAAFGVVVCGCVTTQEMPLAPNVVRLDTHAMGAVFTGQAVPQTMRRAAELTLQNGYAYFRLDQPEMSQGVEQGEASITFGLGPRRRS